MTNWNEMQLNTMYRNEQLKRAANEQLAQTAQTEPEELYRRFRRRFFRQTHAL
jgi:hypothetical protein